MMVLFDPTVCVNLLGIEVGYDLYRALAEDVPLKDVGQGGLGVNREDQYLVALLGQPVGCGRRKSGLAQSALAAKHDVAAVGVFLEDPCQ